MLIGRREQFVGFLSKGWEESTPLQLADMLAYENYKTIEREPAGHPRRKSMKLILDLDSFGGRGAKLQRAGIREIKGKLDQESKQMPFSNARIGSIRKSRRKPANTPSPSKGKA